MMLMRSSHAKIIILTSAMIGLAGCAVLRPLSHLAMNSFSQMVKIRPIPTNLAPVSPTAVVDRLYAQAVTALDKRDYAVALAALQLARDARGNDPRVLNALGVVYDKLGRFDLSSRYYDLADKADPGSKVVAANRRYSQQLQQGGVIEAATIVEAAAVPATPAVVSIDPASLVDRLYSSAVRALQQRDFRTALVALISAQSTRPGDARVLNALGVVNDELGRFDVSAHFYDLAERADPGSKVVETNRRFSDYLKRARISVGEIATPVVVGASGQGTSGPVGSVKSTAQATGQKKEGTPA